MIATESLRLAAVDVASELVQQQYQRQPPLGVSLPIHQLLLQRRVHQHTEAMLNVRVVSSRSRKPPLGHIVRWPTLRHAILKPVIQYFLPRRA